MIIAAKFSSECAECGRVIRRGDRIHWFRGEAARHVACVTAKRAKHLALVPEMTEEQAPSSNPWAMLAAAALAESAPKSEPLPMYSVPAIDAPSLEDVIQVTEYAPIVSTETPRLSRLTRNWTGKRPRPYVVEADETDLDWEPVKRPLYSLLPDEVGQDAQVRAGDLHSIVRPGCERWPLSNGAPSKYYRVWSHNAVDARTRQACAGSVSHRRSLIVGQGTRVVHEYDVDHLESESINGARVTSRLTLSVPHTGTEKLRANLVIYSGDDSLGSVISTDASHRAENPEIWQGAVDAMIEASIIVQDAIISLLRAASDRVLTKEDRTWFRKRSMIVKNSARTALDAVRAWHGASRGRARPTWGVWSRRCDDDAVRALCDLLPPSYGNAIDAALESAPSTSRGYFSPRKYGRSEVAS